MLENFITKMKKMWLIFSMTAWLSQLSAFGCHLSSLRVTEKQITRILQECIE
jgi:hypothetical protein